MATFKENSMAVAFEKDVFMRQLARAEKYLLGKQAAFLGEQLKNVASLNAIRGWLKEPDFESKGYSKAAFSEAMKEVPEFDLLDRVLLYRDILDNAGLTGESQSTIKDFKGHYRLILPEALSIEERALSMIVLKASVRPYFFGFVFKYVPPLVPKPPGSICDGMLFRRGGRFYMLGTALQTTLMAHFQVDDYPDQHPMFGAMTLEVIPTRTFLDTKFALVKYETDRHDNMIKEARDRLG